MSINLHYTSVRGANVLRDNFLTYSSFAKDEQINLTSDKLDCTISGFYSGDRRTHDSLASTSNRTENLPDAILITATNGFNSRYSGDANDDPATIDIICFDSLMMYATFSTGFRGAGINPLPFFTSSARPLSRGDGRPICRKAGPLCAAARSGRRLPRSRQPWRRHRSPPKTPIRTNRPSIPIQTRRSG